MKILLHLILLTLCLLTFSERAESYVQSRTDSDALVKWTGSVTLLDVFLNPANTQGLSPASVTSIASASVSEWDGKSRINLRQNATAGFDQENLNEIFFSTDPTYFNGSGVVGITQVTFKNNTGEIVEADIVINDNYNFSTDINQSNYLGNVLTHELGHFLGLGHSQVMGASMFYSLSLGQSKISADDKAGLYSIYPNGNNSKGSLSGKIIGGNNLIGVFGAHVQAISVSTGEIGGASISDIDGSFEIGGLNLGDQYLIYTSPIVQAGLPSKYNNVRYDFCSSSKKYRGSFFQQCGSSSEGFPQAIKLSSSKINLGNITIRCNLDVPVEYIQNKNISPALFDVQDHTSSGVGNVFTGYFSGQELSLSSVTDYFKIDFSSINWDSLSTSDDIYIELKILNQSFYSPFKANVSIKRDSGVTNVTPKYIQESDGWLNLESTTRLQINRLDPSDNVFEVSISPETMEFPNFPSGLPNSKSDYFPAYSNFEDSLYFYAAVVSVVKSNGNGTFTQMTFKNDQLSDNSQCPDAANTYALTNFTVNGSVSSTKARKNDDGFGCGTVDMSGGSGKGPGGFLIGLILSLILYQLISTIIAQNKLKHYSK